MLTFSSFVAVSMSLLANIALITAIPQIPLGFPIKAFQILHEQARLFQAFQLVGMCHTQVQVVQGAVFTDSLQLGQFRSARNVLWKKCDL